MRQWYWGFNHIGHEEKGTAMNGIRYCVLIVFLYTFAGWMGWAFGQSTPPNAESLVETGAKPVEIPGSFNFSEGPVADGRGNVYFSDYKNNRICKWSTDGVLTVFKDSLKGPLGLDIDPDDRILATLVNGQSVIAIDLKTKAVEVLAETYDGKPLNSPNDIWRDKKGGIYFTDPRFVQMPSPPEQDVMGVYYIPPDRKKLVRVIDDLQKPNGVNGSSDGKYLYVDDTPALKTYVYAIAPDGTVSGRREFAPVGYDGITTDERGNVYICDDGIHIYSPAGVFLERIPVPTKPSNVCFGGKDMRTLFITTIKGAVYSLRMRVKGSPR